LRVIVEFQENRTKSSRHDPEPQRAQNTSGSTFSLQKFTLAAHQNTLASGLTIENKKPNSPTQDTCLLELTPETEQAYIENKIQQHN
jgi:hypothetical protein